MSQYTSVQITSTKGHNLVAVLQDLPATVWLTLDPNHSISDGAAIRCVEQITPEDAQILRDSGVLFIDREILKRRMRESAESIRAARIDRDDRITAYQATLDATSGYRRELVRFKWIYNREPARLERFHLWAKAAIAETGAWLFQEGAQAGAVRATFFYLVVQWLLGMFFFEGRTLTSSATILGLLLAIPFYWGHLAYYRRADRKKNEADKKKPLAVKS